MTSSTYIPDNGRTNSILSLLLHGDQNCVINNVEPEKKAEPQETPEENNPVPDTTADTGKQDNNPPAQLEEEETGIEDKENETKKNKRSFWNPFWQTIKNALTDEEE